MQTTLTALLFTGLLYLTCLPHGLSEPEEHESGTFRMEDYTHWLVNRTINLVNYVAEVGTDVVILSPMTPTPTDARWFSLNINGELPRPVDKEEGRVRSSYLDKFQETYNTSWHNVFKFDQLIRWLGIRKVQHGYADLFRVFIGENGTGDTAYRRSFDVAFTLMTFERHECVFTSKPRNPKSGDTLILNCSVIVNGLWNASLVFRNNYDDSEIVGETKKCGVQPFIGSKICSIVKVKVKAEEDKPIVAYSCRLEFPSNDRLDPKNPLFQNSKWTAKFNEEIICYFQKIYLEAIPSEVTFLCNNMPCGDTASVNDTVTCLAHGYPPPVFDLRVKDVSAQQEDTFESPGEYHESRLFMDTAEEERDEGSGVVYATDTIEEDIRGYEDFRIGPRNVGQMEITCNVSNALGWGYNSLVLKVKSSVPIAETGQLGRPTFSLNDYEDWLKQHRIKLVNYVAEVGTDVLIRSPITPAPVGIRWFSQNLDGELSLLIDKKGGLSNWTYLKKFQETYNIKSSWQNVFDFDELNRWLKIKKVLHGYADVIRVFAEGSSAGNAAEGSAFDVAITLMTFEKHECGFASKPQRPTEGDVFVLNCSIIVNGLWNASVVFRNNYDESETGGEISKCDSQPSTGFKICSTVKVKAEMDILAYSCHLRFPSNERRDPKSPMFQNSKWTDTFNKEVVCYLPQVYLEAIPSDVTFLCNNMPCGDTALVSDTVTCVAHGYPEPVFDIRIQHFSVRYENASKSRDFEVNFDTIFFMDTADEASEAEMRGSENYQISQRDVGRIEISCNASNTLGWGYNSLALEVKLGLPESPRNRSGTFRLEDYSHLLQENFTVNLVNYVAEVGTDVVITSPITPAPVGLRWFSRNMNGELPHREDEEVDFATSSYFEEFQDTYNASWQDVFEFDAINRWLKVSNVRLGYADAFRVFLTGDAVVKPFDVTTTLTVFEKHVCGFTTKPKNPKNGETLLLSCSVIVNGLWQTYLVFRNNYDQSEIIGETRMCGQQPIIGSKICSTVNVKIDADMLAYSCRLEFFPSRRQDPTNAMFQSSKWTAEFNKNFECYFPKIYLEAIPSDVSFLCNNMPCGETVFVNDTVTCLAHGYPQPVFKIRIRSLSVERQRTHDSQISDYYEDDYEYEFFMDAADETNEADIKFSKDYRIKQKDVGQVEITCNVSNALGWGHNTLVIGVKIDEGRAVTHSTEVIDPRANDYETFSHGIDPGLEISRETETETSDVYSSGDEFHAGFVTPTKGAKILISCNGVVCDENHTLFVGGEISCTGVESKFFDKFVLKVNENSTEGDNKGVRYVLQMEDTGAVVVECTAYLSSGVVVQRSVPVIVRGNEAEPGAAAGGIDVGEAERIAGKPPANPESGAAAGKIDIPKRDDGMSAEKAAGDEKPKHDNGNCGQESFFLLQLSLVFIGVFFGQGQFEPL